MSNKSKKVLEKMKTRLCIGVNKAKFSIRRNSDPVGTRMLTLLSAPRPASPRLGPRPSRLISIIIGTGCSTLRNQVDQKFCDVTTDNDVVTPQGIEPWTHRLRVCCSTS